MPFLKNKDEKSVAGLLIKSRQPDQKLEQDQDDNAGIDACSQALIEAVKSGDVQGVSAAIKDAFDILGSQPQDEQSSIEPHSYDAQNEG